MFSRVILTRVYVLRMLYTFCIHDAAHAILIIIINFYRYAPPKTIQRMYVCVRVYMCMYVRTCTRIVERRAHSPSDFSASKEGCPMLLFW